jgi:hypothetical protein
MAPGKGLLQCHVYDHISAGMSALYNVKNLKAVEVAPSAPRRTYYIAAEPYTWDYTPLGYDGCTGAAFTPEQEVFTKTTNTTMGRVYKKARFVQYTDATFTQRVPVPDYYGILGPMLKAEVGDVLEVHFLNRMRVNSSFQVFGGLVPLANTSAYQVGLSPSSSSGGRRLLGRHLAQITAAQAEAEAIIAQSVENMYVLNAVAPGGRTTYQWLVPEAVLGPRDPGAAVYAYVSGVDHIKHINAGLVGPLVVLPKGGLTAAPAADLEVPLLFNIQNEMQSLYLDDNIKAQVGGGAQPRGWEGAQLAHLQGTSHCAPHAMPPDEQPHPPMSNRPPHQRPFPLVLLPADNSLPVPPPLPPPHTHNRKKPTQV